MKVTSKTEYALRTVLDLALRKEEGIIRSMDISQRWCIPIKFLEQILLILKGAGVIGSKRGARGGYFLAKEASDISVAYIGQLMEDKLLSVPKDQCATKEKDSFPELWNELHGVITAKLESVSMQDMVNRIGKMKK